MMAFYFIGMTFFYLWYLFFCHEKVNHKSIFKSLILFTNLFTSLMFSQFGLIWKEDLDYLILPRKEFSVFLILLLFIRGCKMIYRILYYTTFYKNKLMFKLKDDIWIFLFIHHSIIIMHCRLMDMNIFQGITKRYFGIDQHLVRHFVNNSVGLSSSLSM